MIMKFIINMACRIKAERHTRNQKNIIMKSNELESR